MAAFAGQGRNQVTQMKVLITGSNGQLGSELITRYLGRGNLGRGSTSVFAGDLPDLDITSEESVSQVFANLVPDVVINCAAWTAVDSAEEHELAAYAVNAEGPAILAAQCARIGARLVQISTDYVFAGDATEPYAENAHAEPVTAYGRTKRAGENYVQELLPENHLIVRTAWLYGAGGDNFVKTIIRALDQRDVLTVVTDQVGQPTYAGDLADQIMALIDVPGASGIFHATNSGVASWFDFARAILTEIGQDPERILPTDSSSFVRPAPRPPYSVLGHDRWAEIGLTPMRDWRLALHAAVPEILGSLTP